MLVDGDSKRDSAYAVGRATFARLAWPLPVSVINEKDRAWPLLKQPHVARRRA